MSSKKRTALPSFQTAVNTSTGFNLAAFGRNALETLASDQRGKYLKTKNQEVFQPSSIPVSRRPPYIGKENAQGLET